MSGGFDGLERVLDGIRAAAEAGLAPIKINAVIQRGVNDGQALAMARHFRGSGIVLRSSSTWTSATATTGSRGWSCLRRELRDAIAAAHPLEPVRAQYRGEVAERYAYADGAGEIGFIASVTQPFCGDCTRARLSSDGVFYTCLFATAGTDLRTPMRAGASDAELRRTGARHLARGATTATANCAPSCRANGVLRKIEMHYIGG